MNRFFNRGLAYTQRQPSWKQPKSRLQQAPNASSAYGALGALSASRMGMLLGGYLVLVNLGSVCLFWYDKHQAVNKGWRVPEKTLQLSALMGGWIGGLWAMQTFRHKTVKESFQIPYKLAMGLNVGLLMAGAYYHPGLRASVSHLLRR